jgi:endo-1,4-beta-xylanase
MHTKSTVWGAILLVALAASAQAEPATTLKDAYRGAFVVGAAVNTGTYAGRNVRDAAIVASQFDSVSPENDLKWERIHPLPDKYDFAAADRYVAFGEKHRMYIVGHVLVWHNQTPDWVFRDEAGKPLSREALLARLRDHIFAVVGRYKGRIDAWDVVNEAVDEDGSMRQSPWYRIIGEDYIAKAFEYAHEADPEAELLYNDYGLENPAKRAGALALIKKLKDAGVPVATVGIQGHYDLDWPSVQQLDDTIAAFAALGVKVAITELDFDVLPQVWNMKTAEITLRAAQDPKLDPYVSGLPDAVQQKLAERYADVFRTCLKHRDVVDRITVWGVTDKDSWKNDWPVKGRTNYPLLFDRAGKPKPAVDAAIAAANGKKI